MKKLVTLAALMGFASLSFGQGIVSFANNNSTKVSTNGSAMVSTPVGNWYYALFRTGSANSAGPSTSVDPTTAGWTLVAIGTNTAAGGRLSGNQTTEGVAVTPTAPSTDDYAIAGWSANIGTTWASVEAFFGGSAQMTQSSHDAGASAGVGGWFGIAPTFADNIGAQPTGGAINGLFGTTAGLINGFGLSFVQPVPEPTSFALLGLGSAALLIFRRRK